MADNAHLQSEDKEVNASQEQTEKKEGNTEDKMIPKSRLDKVIEQRDEFKRQFEESSEKLTSLEDTVKELQDSVKEKQEDTGDDAFTREEEAALERVAKGLKGKKFITAEDLEEIRRIDRRNNEMVRLSDKYKKGSGYPQFKAEEILVYAKKNGFGDNLEAAYKSLHWDAIIQVETEKRAKGVSAIDSEKPTGGEREQQTETTRKAISEMTDTEWEQHRSSLLGKFRKAVLGK